MPFFGNHTAPHKKYDIKELEKESSEQEIDQDSEIDNPVFGPPASKEELEKMVVQQPNVTP